MSSSNSSQRKERDSLVGPILMVGAGILFLFNNLGWVDWSIWGSLLRLWPLLLIIGGLDLIIGRRSAVGGVLVAVIAVVLLVGGVWFVNADADRSATIVDGQAVAFPLAGADRAVVKIGSATGELRVADGAQAANVLDGEIQSRRGERVGQSSEIQGSVLHVAVEVQGNTTSIFPSAGQGSVWDLRLNQEIPTDLSVSTGVGESILDLRRLTLTGLDLSMGVGKTTVTLPRRGGFFGEISGGIGQTIIQVPANLSVRLEVSTGIGGKSVPDTFTRDGDAYLSPAFASGEETVNLKVSGGIGAIQVEIIPAE